MNRKFLFILFISIFNSNYIYPKKYVYHFENRCISPISLYYSFDEANFFKFIFFNYANNDLSCDNPIKKAYISKNDSLCYIDTHFNNSFEITENGNSFLVAQQGIKNIQKNESNDLNFDFSKIRISSYHVSDKHYILENNLKFEVKLLVKFQNSEIEFSIKPKEKKKIPLNENYKPLEIIVNNVKTITIKPDIKNNLFIIY